MNYGDSGLRHLKEHFGDMNKIPDEVHRQFSQDGQAAEAEKKDAAANFSKVLAAFADTHELKSPGGVKDGKWMDLASHPHVKTWIENAAKEAEKSKTFSGHKLDGTPARATAQGPKVLEAEGKDLYPALADNSSEQAEASQKAEAEAAPEVKPVEEAATTEDAAEATTEETVSDADVPEIDVPEGAFEDVEEAPAEEAPAEEAPAEEAAAEPTKPDDPLIGTVGDQEIRQSHLDAERKRNPEGTTSEHLKTLTDQRTTEAKPAEEAAEAAPVEEAVPEDKPWYDGEKVRSRTGYLAQQNQSELDEGKISPEQHAVADKDLRDLHERQTGEKIEDKAPAEAEAPVLSAAEQERLDIRERLKTVRAQPPADEAAPARKRGTQEPVEDKEQGVPYDTTTLEGHKNVGSKVNGQKQGSSTITDENGNKLAVENHEKDRLQGTQEYWNPETGTIAAKTAYRGGKKWGPDVTYNTSGEADKFGYNLDDKPVGATYKFHPNGKPREVTALVDGKEAGTISWDKDGKFQAAGGVFEGRTDDLADSPHTYEDYINNTPELVSMLPEESQKDVERALYAQTSFSDHSHIPGTDTLSHLTDVDDLEAKVKEGEFTVEHDSGEQAGTNIETTTYSDGKGKPVRRIEVHPEDTGTVIKQYGTHGHTGPDAETTVETEVSINGSTGNIYRAVEFWPNGNMKSEHRFSDGKPLSSTHWNEDGTRAGKQHLDADGNPNIDVHHIDGNESHAFKHDQGGVLDGDEPQPMDPNSQAELDDIKEERKERLKELIVGDDFNAALGAGFERSHPDGGAYVLRNDIEGDEDFIKEITENKENYNYTHEGGTYRLKGVRNPETGEWVGQAPGTTVQPDMEKPEDSPLSDESFEALPDELKPLVSKLPPAEAPPKHLAVALRNFLDSLRELDFSNEIALGTVIGNLLADVDPASAIQLAYGALLDIVPTMMSSQRDRKERMKKMEEEEGRGMPRLGGQVDPKSWGGKRILRNTKKTLTGAADIGHPNLTEVLGDTTHWTGKRHKRFQSEVDKLVKQYNAKFPGDDDSSEGRAWKNAYQATLNKLLIHHRDMGGAEAGMYFPHTTPDESDMVAPHLMFNVIGKFGGVPEKQINRQKKEALNWSKETLAEFKRLVYVGERNLQVTSLDRDPQALKDLLDTAYQTAKELNDSEKKVLKTYTKVLKSGGWDVKWKNGKGPRDPYAGKKEFGLDEVANPYQDKTISEESLREQMSRGKEDDDVPVRSPTSETSPEVVDKDGNVVDVATELGGKGVVKEGDPGAGDVEDAKFNVFEAAGGEAVNQRDLETVLTDEAEHFPSNHHVMGGNHPEGSSKKHWGKGKGKSREHIKKPGQQIYHWYGDAGDINTIAQKLKGLSDHQKKKVLDPEATFVIHEDAQGDAPKFSLVANLGASKKLIETLGLSRRRSAGKSALFEPQGMAINEEFIGAVKGNDKLSADFKEKFGVDIEAAKEKYETDQHFRHQQHDALNKWAVDLHNKNSPRGAPTTLTPKGTSANDQKAVEKITADVRNDLSDAGTATSAVKNATSSVNAYTNRTQTQNADDIFEEFKAKETGKDEGPTRDTIEFTKEILPNIQFDKAEKSRNIRQDVSDLTAEKKELEEGRPHADVADEDLTEKQETAVSEWYDSADPKSVERLVAIKDEIEEKSKALDALPASTRRFAAHSPDKLPPELQKAKDYKEVAQHFLEKYKDDPNLETFLKINRDPDASVILGKVVMENKGTRKLHESLKKQLAEAQEKGEKLLIPKSNVSAKGNYTGNKFYNHIAQHPASYDVEVTKVSAKDKDADDPTPTEISVKSISSPPEKGSPEYEELAREIIRKTPVKSPEDILAAYAATISDVDKKKGEQYTSHPAQHFSEYRDVAAKAKEGGRGFTAKQVKELSKIYHSDMSDAEKDEAYDGLGLTGYDIAREETKAGKEKFYELTPHSAWHGKPQEQDFLAMVKDIYHQWPQDKIPTKEDVWGGEVAPGVEPEPVKREDIHIPNEESLHKFVTNFDTIGDKFQAVSVLESKLDGLTDELEKLKEKTDVDPGELASKEGEIAKTAKDKKKAEKKISSDDNELWNEWLRASPDQIFQGFEEHQTELDALDREIEELEDTKPTKDKAKAQKLAENLEAKKVERENLEKEAVGSGDLLGYFKGKVKKDKEDHSEAARAGAEGYIQEGKINELFDILSKHKDFAHTIDETKEENDSPEEKAEKDERRDKRLTKLREGLADHAHILPSYELSKKDRLDVNNTHRKEIGGALWGRVDWLRNPKNATGKLGANELVAKRIETKLKDLEIEKPNVSAQNRNLLTPQARRTALLRGGEYAVQTIGYNKEQRLPIPGKVIQQYTRGVIPTLKELLNHIRPDATPKEREKNFEAFLGVFPDLQNMETEQLEHLQTEARDLIGRAQGKKVEEVAPKKEAVSDQREYTEDELNLKSKKAQKDAGLDVAWTKKDAKALKELKTKEKEWEESKEVKEKEPEQRAPEKTKAKKLTTKQVIGGLASLLQKHRDLFHPYVLDKLQSLREQKKLPSELKKQTIRTTPYTEKTWEEGKGGDSYTYRRSQSPSPEEQKTQIAAVREFIGSKEFKEHKDVFQKKVAAATKEVRAAKKEHVAAKKAYEASKKVSKESDETQDAESALLDAKRDLESREKALKALEGQGYDAGHINRANKILKELGVKDKDLIKSFMSYLNVDRGSAMRLLVSISKAIHAPLYLDNSLCKADSLGGPRSRKNYENSFSRLHPGVGPLAVPEFWDEKEKEEDENKDKTEKSFSLYVSI